MIKTSKGKGRQMQKHRLIIVSLDAVGKRDMEYMLSLPNFSAVVNNGAFCDNVESVYPSLTYPAHTSIVSGLMPKNSGIVANTKLQPNREFADWLYKRKYINGNTIVDEAKKHGYSVAALLWPVMGAAKIDYNLPEVLVTRKYQNQIVACLLNGTPGYLLKLNKRFGHIRNGISQPELDDFVMESVRYTIEEHDPDMMLIHLTDVDTTRHKTGADNDKVRAALERHDKRIGMLKEWLSKARPMEDTTLIVLGDHCQRDADRISYPNKFLADKGLIDIKDGKIVDYRAVAKSCDGSAYIYLNEKYASDAEVIEKVADALNEMKETEEMGVLEVFTSEEAAKMGADENCIAMIESKPGYYFLGQFEIRSEAVDDSKNYKMYGIHGCLPTDPDLVTFFAAEGFGIKKGARIETMHLWDEGPTIAKLMGWDLGKTDGNVVDNILE